ncbi:MAG: TonB-dependent receptor [Gemmatimonadota bacterium]
MRIFSYLSGLSRPAMVPVLLVAGLLAVLPPAAAGQFPGELRGRVVDVASGEGLVGVEVTIPARARAAVTTADGTFHFRGLEPGTVDVRASRLGYEPQTMELVVRNGTVSRIEFRLTPRPLTLPGVQVATARGSGAVLEREAILASGARTLGDVVATLPGAAVVRRGVGGREELLVRGASADQILVLIDGVPANDPLTGVADLSLLQAGAVERVELLAGALGARFGAGAMGGVLLVQTRSPTHPLEGELAVGDLGERGGSLVVRRSVGPASFQAGFRQREADGAFAFDREDALGGGRPVRRNADFEQIGLHLGGRGPLLEGEWSVRVRHDQTERGIPGKSYAPSHTARQGEHGLTGIASWRVEGARTQLAGDVRHRRVSGWFRDPSPPLGLPFDDHSELREFGGALRAELIRSGGGVLGGSIESTTRHLSGTVVETGTPARRTEIAGALHGEVSTPGWPGQPRWSGAVRVHRDGVLGGLLFAHDLGFQLELSGFRLHAAHRSAFSPPSAGDLYFREGVGVRPNPDLRAERIRGEVEVGAHRELAVGPARIQLSGEAFRGNVDDMIVWSPDFRFVWSPRNVDVRRNGWEVRARLWNQAGGPTAEAHFTSTRVEYRNGGGTSGAQVVYRPRSSGGVSLGWEGERSRLSVQGRYIGVRYPVPARVNALPPFWSVGLSAGVRLDIADWTLRPALSIDRLLDDRSPFIHGYPEPGRTLALSLRIHPAR